LTKDEQYMHRCLQLAKKGFGAVAPNPMVGCVIVCDDKIIGEGYHEKYGEAHAEVNAIASVKDKNFLPFSTVYVSLEPCAHFGKTPPCTNLLIENKVKKVVVACLDPHEKVAGKGVQMLKDAGIEVEVGVLEKESKTLNRRFFVFHQKERPFVILKWAESKDGFIWSKNQSKISGPLAQLLLHQWRTEEMAFLTGKNTLLKDNPKLNNRFLGTNQPIRIVLDSHLETQNKDLFFYDQSQKTMVFNLKEEQTVGSLRFCKLEKVDVPSILNKLWCMGIQSLVVEGGAMVLEAFLKSGIYDEIRVFQSKELMLQEGVLAPKVASNFTPVLDLKDDILKINNLIK